MKKKINNFIGKESLTKTLRFKLNPVGKTEENFVRAGMLESDEKRELAYEQVKKLIDKYHKAFIDSVLSAVELEGLDTYVEEYFKKGRKTSDNKALGGCEEKLRKQIAKAFSSDMNYNKLFKQDMIEELLPSFLEDANEIETVREFKGFSTYFVGFHDNRKNMYTEKADSTSIAYRLINENLPKYVDNMASFAIIEEALPDEMNLLNEDMEGIIPVNLGSMFEIRGFNLTLTQKGIDVYNQIIGGMTFSDGTKIKGINEYVNLFNQKKSKNERLPLLKPLFKQILSDRDSVSFIPESFETDQEVLDAIRMFIVGDDEKLGVLELLSNCETLFGELEQYELDKVWLKSGKPITDISKGAFGDWEIIERNWQLEYDKVNPPKKNLEKHVEKRKTAYKAIKSFSVYEIGELGNDVERLVIYLKECIKEKIEEIKMNYNATKNLLCNTYKESKRLSKNDFAIELIKKLLDSVKELERMFMTS